MTYRINGTTVIDASRNVIIGSGSTDPSSPTTGMLFFNTSSGVLKGYTGTAWVTLTNA
jgi:hypothetical protein